MKRSAIYSLAAVSALAGGVFLGTTGAQATTAHCDLSSYPNKVEVNAGPSYDTGLAPGTEVCIKAGTQTVIVLVDDEGTITNNTIMNKPGNAYLGISYYAYGEEQCETDSSGNCES